MKKRVVITGIGVVCSTGKNVEAFSEALRKGVCGVGDIAAFDPEGLPYKRGAEVRDFQPVDSSWRRRKSELDRASQLGLSAAHEAVIDSGLDMNQLDRQRCGVAIGTTMGGMVSAGQYYRRLKAGRRPPALKLLEYPLHTVGSHISARYGLLGPNLMVSTACSSSNVAIGEGVDMVRYGEADVMIVGGVEAFADLGWVGFGSLHNMSTTTCRPFDKNRNGLILGEGAGFLVIEDLNHALSRNAAIHAELKGVGASSDAYHMTAPDPAGKGAAASMLGALEDGAMSLECIDYICAHGTATLLNDAMECTAIRRVFGELAYDIPISSIKSMIGHTLGASGAIGLIATVIAIMRGFMPPTINYETPDPKCDLDCVPNVARIGEIDNALCNSFGFGGNNCSVLVSRFQDCGSQ